MVHSAQGYMLKNTKREVCERGSEASCNNGAGTREAKKKPTRSLYPQIACKGVILLK